MQITYNGIDMGVTELYAFDAQAVFDDSGVDYLYTRFEIVVRALINGQVLVNNGGANQNGPFVSYAFGDLEQTISQGGARPTPEIPVIPSAFGEIPDGVGILQAPRSRLREVISKPNAPPLTHQAVRHRLSTPRGKLFVFGSAPNDPAATSRARITMLESPTDADTPCDCKNGPFPKVLSVHTALGDATTLMVDFAVETYVNESSTNGVGLAGTLLSNRFAQTQVIDDAGYTTILTGGVAIFRTDRLYSQLESPDQRRPLLFLPIPNGFVRENIQVRGREDVTGVEYSFRDVQVPVNFPAGAYARAAKITALHRQAIVTNMDVLEGALNTYERVLGLKANKYFADQDRHEADKAGAAAKGRPAPRPSIMGKPNHPFQIPFRQGMTPPQAPPPAGGKP